MQRYFVTEESVKENQITIANADAHHIIKVLRMKAGDQILCVLPDGKSALCNLTEISDTYVTATVETWLEEQRELPMEVTIASGLPKGDKLEYIVQKGTELGAHAFLPFVATRSITKWDNKKSQKKIERLGKISKEAAEQLLSCQTYLTEMN